MKIKTIEPPRTFQVGIVKKVILKDCAHLELENNEQVTFLTPSAGEYDVTRKSWGFYATPSLNKRLPKYGLRPALIKSSDGTYFIFLVERGKMEELSIYLTEQRLALLCWLDDTENLAMLEKAFLNDGTGSQRFS